MKEVAEKHGETEATKNASKSSKPHLRLLRRGREAEDAIRK
jgi:hypothetical protein